MTPTRHDYVPGFTYDRLLPLYDTVQKLLGVPRLHRRLVDFAELDEHTRTLEIGCGTGNLTILAARRHPGTELVGIDPDPLALRRAQRKAGPGLRVRFERGYAQDLPYPDASFDRVLSALMLHHLDPDVRRGTLREALRVLRPGGTLHVLDLGGRVTAADGFAARLQLRSSHLRDNIGDRLPAALREAGFTGVSELGRQVTRVGPVTFYRGVVATPGPG